MKNSHRVKQWNSIKEKVMIQLFCAKRKSYCIALLYNTSKSQKCYYYKIPIKINNLKFIIHYQTTIVFLGKLVISLKNKNNKISN